MTMKAAHISAWRDYLAEQLHQPQGTTKRDARRQVTRWLKSLQQAAAMPSSVVPETPPQRSSSPNGARQGSRATGGAH